MNDSDIYDENENREIADTLRLLSQVALPADPSLELEQHADTTELRVQGTSHEDELQQVESLVDIDPLSEFQQHWKPFPNANDPLLSVEQDSTRQLHDDETSTDPLLQLAALPEPNPVPQIMSFPNIPPLPLLSPEQQLVLLSAQIAGLSPDAIALPALAVQVGPPFISSQGLGIPIASLPDFWSSFAGVSQVLQPGHQLAPRPVAALLPGQGSSQGPAMPLSRMLPQPLIASNPWQMANMSTDMTMDTAQAGVGLQASLAFASPAYAASVEAAVAKEEEDGPKILYHAKTRRPYRHESFPQKLYRMLEDVEEQGKDDIVSFIADGTAFEIHRPDAFEEEVISRFFRHKSLASFRRQLSMYGFKKARGGPTQGGYRHEKFVRGKPELCKEMKRVAEFDLILSQSEKPAAPT